jgi:hypothetical protein
MHHGLSGVVFYIFGSMAEFGRDILESEPLLDLHQPENVEDLVAGRKPYQIKRFSKYGSFMKVTLFLSPISVTGSVFHV